jgi:hypothetical protein
MINKRFQTLRGKYPMSQKITVFEDIFEIIVELSYSSPKSAFTGKCDIVIS